MLDEFDGQLIVVEHHVDDVLEIPWTAIRSSWYWASSKPHVRIDGKYMKMGATSCPAAAGYYRDLIEQRLSETEELSPIQVGGSYWFEGDSLKVIASFTLLDEVTLVDLQAHVIITEDDVWESGVHLDHLTRAAQSRDITLTQVGETADAPASFYFDPIWNPNRLHCVVCLQRMGYENADKEIYQTAFLTEGFSDIPPDQARSADLRLSLAPNPFVSQVQGSELSIQLDWPSCEGEGTSRWGRFRVFDARGREVGSIAPLTAAGNSLRTTWDGRDRYGAPLPGGQYWLQAQTSGGSVSRRVLILK